MALDYYKVLGVERDANAQTIKRAFRQRAKSVHPDRNNSPRAEDHFRLVYMSYEILNDPLKRELYDRILEKKEQFQEQERMRKWQANASRQSEGYSAMPYREFETSFSSALHFHFHQSISFIGFLIISGGGFMLIFYAYQNMVESAQNYLFTIAAIILGTALLFQGIKIILKILRIWFNRNAVE
ncbi:MAG: DnaJ domain-containing protein [Bacteroidia bacterium]